MENTLWNLNNIYESFDSEKFKNNIKTLKEKIKSLYVYISSADALSTSEVIKNYIKQTNDILEISSMLSEYALLRLSSNSYDNEAMKYYDIINNIISDMEKIKALFTSYIKNINNIEEIINSNKYIKEHEFFINEIKKKSLYTLTEQEEAVYSKMRSTGSVSWEKLWENITSSLKCKFIENGTEKSVPLSELRNMAYSDNSQTRKNAYFSEIESLSSVAPQAAFALNAIKGEVINMCKIRGYKSPLNMTLIDSRISEATFSAMISAIKNSLPYFRKYFKRKAEILGHKNSLPFYDLFTPIGENSVKFSYKEAQDFIIKNFSSFCPDMCEFAEKAFNSGWIDVYPRDGKTGGAFCSNIHSIGESRILINFTGSFNDVVTLAHELGHAYHGEQLNNETPINSDYPMPIAETASTFCECIIKNNAVSALNPNMALTLIENDISDNAQIIVDILSRFIFEDQLFKAREEGPLSADELCSIMEEAQEKTYGDVLSVKHKYMWVCKPHYYDAMFNYYNFPYAFGLLFAKGLYGLYKREGNVFVEKYKKLLSITGKANIENIALTAGIDITKPEFWKESINGIKTDIDKFISLTENLI